MTPASFEFKLAIAVGLYKKFYKYKPLKFIGHRSDILMLDKYDLIEFTIRGPMYKGMHVSYSANLDCEFVELGSDTDKLKV